VNPDVRVRLVDGTLDSLSVAPEPTASAGKVLFFDTGQLATLERIMVALGGTRRREPLQIMEVPNQPIGDSMRILDTWIT
jgi:hypothetical protein